jgi:PIN domain nuclease of toxin-antitoxin system
VGGGALRLLLDTHILLWWLDAPGRLSPRQTHEISGAHAEGERLAVAAVTLWEIAKLVEYRRLTFDDPIELVLDGIERNPALGILPLDARVALESTRLGDQMPGDPADQLIVATARVHGLRLVTSDERIRRSKTVPVI